MDYIKYINNLSVYYPADIRLLLKLNSSKALRWISTYKRDIKRVNQTRVLNFFSLIEIYVINRLLEVGVSHKKIREAYENLKEKSAYPFATNIIYTFDKNIYTKNDNFIRSDNCLGIDAVLKEFSEKISYKDNTAYEFYPLSKSKNIVVNPLIQFGQPVIKNTRIPVEDVYDMLKTNGSETVMFLYDLNMEIINDITNFYN